jgi:hypothetical protein
MELQSSSVLDTSNDPTGDGNLKYPTGDGNLQYCRECQKRKDKSLFVKAIKSCTPLVNVTNMIDSRGYYQTCRHCREQRSQSKQRRDRIRREEKDNITLQSMNNCSWEEVINMINGGSVFRTLVKG